MTRYALLWPKRQRCAGCRGWLNVLVLAGQWCSYECANHAPPSRVRSDWPRQHFTYDGKWIPVRKTSYFSEQEAALATHGASDSGCVPYLCNYCLTWHIGHPVKTLTSQQDALD